MPLHAAYHIERRGRFAAQGDLQKVLLDALLYGLAHLGLDLEVAVRRAQPPDALVGTPVVVVAEPQAYPVPGLLKAGKLNP